MYGVHVRIDFVSPALAGLFLTLTPISVVVLNVPRGLVVRTTRQVPCDDQRTVLVRVLTGARIRLAGKELRREELGARLHGIFRTRAERVLYVNAETGVAFQDVVEIIEIAGEFVDYVGLLTPSVKTRPGFCFAISPIPFSTDVYYHKPPVEMKEVPLWPW